MGPSAFLILILLVAAVIPRPLPRPALVTTVTEAETTTAEMHSDELQSRLATYSGSLQLYSDRMVEDLYAFLDDPKLFQNAKSFKALHRQWKHELPEVGELWGLLSARTITAVNLEEMVTLVLQVASFEKFLTNFAPLIKSLYRGSVELPEGAAPTAGTPIRNYFRACVDVLFDTCKLNALTDGLARLSLPDGGDAQVWLLPVLKMLLEELGNLGSALDSSLGALLEAERVVVGRSFSSPHRPTSNPLEGSMALFGLLGHLTALLDLYAKQHWRRAARERSESLLPRLTASFGRLARSISVKGTQSMRHFDMLNRGIMEGRLDTNFALPFEADPEGFGEQVERARSGVDHAVALFYRTRDRSQVPPRDLFELLLSYQDYYVAGLLPTQLSAQLRAVAAAAVGEWTLPQQQRKGVALSQGDWAVLMRLQRTFMEQDPPSTPQPALFYLEESRHAQSLLAKELVCHGIPVAPSEHISLHHFARLQRNNRILFRRMMELQGTTARAMTLLGQALEHSQDAEDLRWHLPVVPALLAAKFELRRGLQTALSVPGSHTWQLVALGLQLSNWPIDAGLEMAIRLFGGQVLHNTSLEGMEQSGGGGSDELGDDLLATSQLGDSLTSIQ